MAAQAALWYSPVAGDAEEGWPENCELSQQSPRPYRSLRVGVLVTVATAVALTVAVVPLPLPPLGEREGPEGTTSLASWVVSLASLRLLSRMSKECNSEIVKVHLEMYEAYWGYYAACNGTTNFSEASEDCLAAERDASEHYYRVERYHSGNCTDEEHMLCNITQVLGGLDYSRGKCFPKVCQPKNMLLTFVDDEKKSGLCTKSATAANGSGNVTEPECTVIVACEGHDVLTRDVLEGGLNAPGRSTMSALAIVAIVQGAKLLW